MFTGKMPIQQHLLRVIIEEKCAYHGSEKSKIYCHWSEEKRRLLGGDRKELRLRG